MDVTGKVAIVTGGGRGIGRGIALALARNGADVVVAEIIDENGRKTAGEVEGLGRRSRAIAVDVTDQDSVDGLVGEALAHFGHIDILVNNAGIIGAPGWEQRDRTNEDDWDLVYEVNVKGVARVTDAVAPHMKERQYGKIVNIASVAARRGGKDMPQYYASKAAVVSLTQSLATRLAPYAINVNAICPGPILTPPLKQLGETKPEVFARIREAIPMGRYGKPQEIANVALFLASDEASFVTGGYFVVDGSLWPHSGIPSLSWEGSDS